MARFPLRVALSAGGAGPSRFHRYAQSRVSTVPLFPQESPPSVPINLLHLINYFYLDVANHDDQSQFNEREQLEMLTIDQLVP